MRYLLIAALISIFFISCEKKNCGCAPPYQVYYLKARVVNTSDVSCHLPVLDFSEDSVRIRMTTGRDDLQYTVTQLPQDFNVLNKKLYVNTVKLKSDEDFPCPAIGFSYPHVKILDTKNRD